MADNRKTLFVFLNPKAGLTQADKLQEKIRNWADRNSWRLLVHITEADDDYRAILRDALDAEQASGAGIDAVAAAGGDGTVSLVIGALYGLDIPLVIIPSGTTNVYSMSFAIPPEPERCLDLLVKPHMERKVDLMEINGHIHMMNAGVGFNSRLINYTTREDKRKFGMMAYVRNVVRSVRMQHQADFTLTVDGVSETIRASEIFILNVGFNISDYLDQGDFSPEDGSITALVIRPSDLQTGREIVMNTLTGKKREKEIICQYNFRNEMVIECDRAIIAQADGEAIGYTPLAVKVLPGAYRLITPEKQLVRLPLGYFPKYILDLVNNNLSQTK